MNQYMRCICFATLTTVAFFNQFCGVNNAALASGWQLTGKATSTEKELDFPTDRSIGTIYCMPRKGQTAGQKMGTAARAQGKIFIGKDNYVTFEANQYFFKNPQVIAKFPVDAFDCLKLRLVSMDDSEDNLEDKSFKVIQHFTGVSKLLIDKADVSDKAMEGLGALTNLEVFSAMAVPLTGSFFEHWTGLKKIRSINMDATSINDDVLKRISQFKDLELLRVGRTRITPVGLKYLVACQKIKVLDIGKDSYLDDNSMKTVRQLKNLCVLSLKQTPVTMTGLLELKGLKLKLLTLPAANYTPKEKIILKATFPGTSMIYGKVDKQVDSYTDAMFAPISR